MRTQSDILQKVSTAPTINLSRIINNTVISLLGQVITWSSTLVLTLAYGRFLGDVKLGELYFAITFVSLIGFPIELGFNQQLTRDVAQGPEKALRYFSNMLLIKVTLWLILYSLLLLICRLLNYTTEITNLVSMCGITLLSSSVATIFASSYYAYEKVTFPVIGAILEKGFGGLCGFILLKNGASVQVMALVLMSGSLINALWQAVCFFRLMGLHFTIDFALIRRLVYTSIPFTIYGILGVIYYRLDTVLLSFLASTAVVGWYGAGYRLFDTLVFLPSIVINAIMYPVFSKLSVNSTTELKTAVEKTLSFLLISSLPIATLMITDAAPIIGFLYHRSEFVHTVPVLQALAPGIVFLYINSVLGSILVSTKREKKITLMAAIALVFNLGLNMILIPLYEHIGAAVVTSLTELLLCVLSLFFVPKNLLSVKSLQVAAKLLLACSVMALSTWPLRTFSIFISIPVATLVYLLVLVLLKAVAKEDVQAIYNVVKNRTKTKAPVIPNAVQGLEFISLQATLPLVAINNAQIQQWNQKVNVQMAADNIGCVPSRATFEPSQQEVWLQATAKRAAIKKVILTKIPENRVSRVRYR